MPARHVMAPNAIDTLHEKLQCNISEIVIEKHLKDIFTWSHGLLCSGWLQKSTRTEVPREQGLPWRRRHKWRQMMWASKSYWKLIINTHYIAFNKIIIINFKNEDYLWSKYFTSSSQLVVSMWLLWSAAPLGGSRTNRRTRNVHNKPNTGVTCVSLN